MTRTLLTTTVYGTLLTVAILANGEQPQRPQTQPLDAAAGPLTQQLPESLTHEHLGVRVEATPDILVLHMPLFKHAALVAEVRPQSLAEMHQICPGDVILAVDGRLLRSPAELIGLVPQDLVVIHAGQPRHVQLGTLAAPQRPQFLLHPPAGTTLKAVSLNGPQGSVNLTGMNGLYKLEARFPTSNGNNQVVQQEGSLQQVLTAINQLPEPLRQATLERLK